MIISNFPQKAGGVESFNGRTGAVTPQTGDYTATMVGALPDTTAIPSKTSDLTNDSNFITSAGAPVQSVNGSTGAVTITAAGLGAEASGNKVTSLSSASTDAQYPSAKCVYDIVGDVETLLAAI